MNAYKIRDLITSFL